MKYKYTRKEIIKYIMDNMVFDLREFKDKLLTHSDKPKQGAMAEKDLLKEFYDSNKKYLTEKQTIKIIKTKKRCTCLWVLKDFKGCPKHDKFSKFRDGEKWLEELNNSKSTEFPKIYRLDLWKGTVQVSKNAWYEQKIDELITGYEALVEAVNKLK